MAEITPKSHYVFICLVYLINTLIFFGINKFTKISVHSASIATVGTLIATFIPLGQTMMIVSATLLFSVMTGIMIWSRVVLHCHTLGQAVSGATLGALLPLIERFIIYPMLV
jgi:hypothetical protein